MSDNEKPPIDLNADVPVEALKLPDGYNPSGCWPKALIDANKAAVAAENAKSPPAPEKTAPQPAVEPSPEITFADFQKVDIRAGEVLAAERVPKSNKLIKLQVSFGTFTRQILAGVGLSFGPEALVGERFLFVVNLAPRKMMGLESHGMMLAAGDDPDELSLTKTHIPEGTRIG